MGTCRERGEGRSCEDRYHSEVMHTFLMGGANTLLGKGEEYNVISIRVGNTTRSTAHIAMKRQWSQTHASVG